MIEKGLIEAGIGPGPVRFGSEPMAVFVARLGVARLGRALTGLSMGGGHTIYTGFFHPELFGALGSFSPGLPRFRG